MKCPKCNALIEDDAKFCPYCGESLSIEEEKKEDDDSLKEEVSVEDNNEVKETPIEQPSIPRTRPYKKGTKAIVSFVLAYTG